MGHFWRGSLSFVLLFAGACSDECLKDPTPYAFDEPGPWGDTPAEVFGHMEDPVSGTLSWVGPLNEGELEPDLAQTSATFEITLDTNSVAGIQNNPVGACDGRLEIDATLSIVTADGALDESIPLVLMTGPGSNRVSAIVDLTDYDFAGTLELTPSWTKHEMLLYLFWDLNMEMTGMMTTGNALEGQGPGNPDAKPYAVIFGNG